MAKSKSFFGLRRGSTKSMTFQVLNGAQITKDRVVDVKNPRTRTQMVQRMIMATAGSAYKHMREIVDHSFEGVSYGQRSYSEFMRLNVHDMVEDVRGDLGQFSYNPFGDTGLYPSPFIIARGSLKYNSALAGFYEEPNTVFVQLPALGSDNEKPSVSEQAAAWGLQLGDVLTFAFIFQTSVNNTWEFGFLRIMFRKESDSELNEDSFRECFDIDSSLPVLVADYSSNTFYIMLETPVNDELDVFGTTILSRRSNSRWLRSNAQIIFPGSPVNSPTAAEALATYPIGTDYILNGANIGGGGITPDTRLRMVTRFPNGAPIYTSESEEVVVVTFNREFSIDELANKLQMVFYDVIAGEAILLDRQVLDTESQKVWMVDSEGQYYLSLQIEGQSLIFSDEEYEGYIFDIDYNHQHRREKTIQNGEYLLQLPSLASNSNILPLVQVSNFAQDFDFSVNSTDVNNGYKPVCRNANGEFVTDEWFTNEEGESGLAHIREILKLVLVMEFGGDISDYSIGGFVFQPTGNTPLINLLN